MLPTADGSSGTHLTTDGSGVLSWTASHVPSSADGQALGSATLEWSDLFLADSSTIQFGADQDVTLTHVADAGIMLNTTMELRFRDSAISIGSPADGDLDINADDEIELNSTLIDINGNVEISGTLAQADAITMATNKKIIFRDAAIHISSTADGDLSIAADDEIDITSTLIDINGNVEISGTLAQVGVATFTARDIHSGGITIANDGTIGSVGDADSIAISSAGVVTMTQIPVLSAGLNVSGGTIAGTIATATQNSITTATGLVSVGALDSGSITSGFTSIDVGAGAITTTGTGTIGNLVVDDVAVNGKVITMTGSSGDTFVTTVAANGATSLVTTDAAAANAHLQITADGTVDIDGTTITLDSAGDIVLDADGADIVFKDDGTSIMTMSNSSTDFVMTVATQDKDFKIVGDDGGSAITPFKLDMSAGGDLFLTGGLIDLKNDGSNVSQIKFYCESSNAHAQTLIGAVHSLSANNTLTLPDGADGNLLSSGKAITHGSTATEHGPGAIATSFAPITRRSIFNGVITTKIHFDLTALGAKGATANDVIGLPAGGNAFIGRYVTSTYGIVYKAELACIELPAVASGTVTTDIDIATNSSGTIAYDAAGGTAKLFNTGGMVAGQELSNITPALTANNYFYLVEGDTAATDAVYNAGQFILTLYGHAIS